MKKILLLSTMFILIASTFSMAQKRVLVEKFTSAKCGNCPDGTAKLTTITGNEPNVIWVTHHAGFIVDALLFPEIDTIASTFTFGAPTATIDRIKFSGQQDVAVGTSLWQSNISSQLTQTADVDVTVDGNFDATSRVANIDVNAIFSSASTAQGEYRINVFVVEDSVVGSGSGYNQANYFNSTAGHPFQGLGNPIVNYPHRHVVRDVISTAWGMGGIIPNTTMANTTYTANFSYQIPMDYDLSKVRFVAFVTDFSQGVDQRNVLNANQEDLSNFGMIISNTAKQIPFVQALSIQPNPATTFVNLKVESSENQQVEILISNVSGQTILTKENVNLQTGTNIYPLPVDQLANGLYFITMKKGKYLTTQKLFINK